MAGLTTFSTPAAAARASRHPPCSSSPCAALSLPIFSRRPAGRSRAVAVTVVPVARYGRGGGGFRSGQGRGRRPRESQSNLLDSDDEALDVTRITSSSVRLIDEQQNMVGVISREEAVQRAEDAELDLVIVSADADPPVLRIMDHNKYRYEQERKKKDQQKRSTGSQMDIKEVKMGFNIDAHDYSVRLRSAQRFLKDGDKVKVVVNLKRRETDFRDMAIEMLKRFQDDIGELATVESKDFTTRNILIVLHPNKVVIRKAQEASATVVSAPEPPNTEKASATEVSAPEPPNTEEASATEVSAPEPPNTEEASATEVSAQEPPNTEEASATEVSAPEPPNTEEASATEVSAQEPPNTEEASATEVSAQEPPNTEEASATEVSAQEPLNTEEASATEVSAPEPPNTEASATEVSASEPSNTEEASATEVSAPEPPNTEEASATEVSASV